MMTRPNGDAHIKHREYIADILAGMGTPTPFDLTAVAINPGQAATFPWLSKIAANYESYVFDSLKFCYETEAPSSLGGTLVLTVDYDASDSAPVSKAQAMTYRSAVRSAPWTACEHISLGEDLHKSKTYYVRPGAQPPSTDIKTYDVGNLFVISQGVTTSQATMGELYVEYSVRLLTPVYEPAPVILNGGTFTAGGTITPVNPLGTAPVADPQNVGVTVDTSGGSTIITFARAGLYLVGITFTGTVLTDADYNGGTGTLIELSQTVNTAGTSLSGLLSYVALAGSQLQFGIATATTLTDCVVYIASAPAGGL